MLATRMRSLPNGNDRTFRFSSNQFDFDLRDYFEATVGRAPVGGETINVIIDAGVIFGATSTSSYGFDTGEWPSGVTINLYQFGLISGKGGNGGDGQGGDNNPGDSGGNGGDGLRARVPLNLHFMSGAIIQGGGGGGAGGGGDQVGFAGPFNRGGGGGGGAGAIPGVGGGHVGDNQAEDGDDGSLNSGGDGGHDSSSASNLNGGDGGNPGQSGDSSGNGGFGLDAPGGSGGDSVRGWSNVTEVVGDGTYKGSKTG